MIFLHALKEGVRVVERLSAKIGHIRVQVPRLKWCLCTASLNCLHMHPSGRQTKQIALYYSLLNLHFLIKAA